MGWSPGHCWFSTTTIGPCIARELTIWTISSHTSTELVKINCCVILVINDTPPMVLLSLFQVHLMKYKPQDSLDYHVPGIDLPPMSPVDPNAPVEIRNVSLIVHY